MQSEWAVDSSSYITLKIDPLSGKPVKDKPDGKVSAFVYLKLSSLSHINMVKNLVPCAHSLFSHPLERFGWYDLCYWVSCRNLYELYENGRKLKDQSDGKITFTSALLLREGESV